METKNMHRSLDSLPISSTKRDYVRNKLNPLLGQLVIELLGDEPVDPNRHAYFYLRKMSGVEDELLCEISALKEKVALLSDQIMRPVLTIPLENDVSLGSTTLLEESLQECPEDEIAKSDEEKEQLRAILEQMISFHNIVPELIGAIVERVKKVILDNGQHINVNEMMTEKVMYIISSGMLGGSIITANEAVPVSYNVGDLCGLSILDENGVQSYQLTAVNEVVLWKIPSCIVAADITRLGQTYVQVKAILQERIKPSVGCFRVMETGWVMFIHSGTILEGYLTDIERCYIVADGIVECLTKNQVTGVLLRGSLVPVDGCLEFRAGREGCHIYVLRREFMIA